MIRKIIVNICLSAVVVLTTSCGSSLDMCHRMSYDARSTAGKPVTSVARKTVPQLSENDALRFKYFYYEALNQQTQEHYDAAFELLRHCLTINPYAAEAYFSLSAYYSELQQDSMALDCMKRAAELSPNNDIYQERLAAAYIGVKNYPEATKAFEQLYASHKNRTDVLETILRLYSYQEDYDNVIRTLDRIEAIEGSSEQIALGRMRVYSLRGDKKKELNELKKLADKYPNDMNYRVMMGNWLLQNGKSYEALLEYNKVLKEEPGNLAVRMSLLDYYRKQDKDSIANMMQEQMLVSTDVPWPTKLQLMRNVVEWNEDHGGDSTQVLNLFRRILAEPQQESDMTELMAAYMKLKKMPQDSIDSVLENALRIEPDNASVRLQLLQSAWASEDTDRIIALSSQGVEYNPEEMVFYYFLGLAHYQKNERDESLHVLRQGAAQINEQSDKDLVSEFYGIMGEILHDKGLEDEAFAAYDSCLHYKPDNLGTLNNYAYYLSLKRKDLQKAEQMSYRTIKAEPTNATFLDTYAWILFEEERYEEAKIYIDQTLLNDSVASGVVLEHAGDIYAKTNDMEKAMLYWKQAVEAGNDSKVLLRKIRNRKYIREDEK